MASASSLPQHIQVDFGDSALVSVFFSLLAIAIEKGWLIHLESNYERPGMRSKPYVFS